MINNFRNVNDNDILKEWFEFREETDFCYLTDEDKKHSLKVDAFCEKIMRNVPNKNKTYVEKQLEFLYTDFMRYMGYYNEKYYRNGFVDGVQLLSRCFRE